MSRASEFIRLYNEVDAYLRRRTGADDRRSFSHVVQSAARTDRAVRHVRDLLIDYGQLRNAIIHSDEYPEKIIAEPNEETVQEFSRIAGLVMSPPRLIPAFQRVIRCFSPDDPVVSALAYMRDRGYSQVVIQTDDGLQVLTVEGIARWLGRRVEENGMRVEDETLSEAVACEPPGSFVVMGRDDTIFDAQAAFIEHPAPGRARLAVIIVTSNGNRSETPLGLVTPWDLMAAARDGLPRG
ncbi:CBS domain-containing protein [Nitrolancea hollandica]|uniref:CBS domain-containing protein n=1 Tax=Nitrolancea hollandica Lb TaxID=1129897 RepID=I4EJW5_9BACT|nr:CBS domain-containing protein [Nitrolancea hollandica]CCF84977.1 conserved hypothetical protein [Nitrolancea hollandica Lb]